MKLIYTKRSPYARKVLVFALEKNIKIDLVEENLMAKSDQLKNSNPVAKVPTLILDDGSSICDSSVICEYFEFIRPQPILIPKESILRFEVLNIDAIAKGMTDIAVSIFFENLLHADNPNQKFIENKKNSINDCLKFFENNLSKLDVFNSASISAACAIGYYEFRFSSFNSRDKFPKLMSWYDRFIQRPSLLATVPVQ